MYAFARALHVLAVVFWIGGVAFVTMTLLPAIRMTEGQNRLHLFDRIERGFARQARGTTLVAGATGFYLLWRMGTWEWFASTHRWYIHLMILVWMVFTVMLFVLEPLVLHRFFHEAALRDEARAFAVVERLHRFLLSMSIVAIVGGVLGAHGCVR